MRGLHIRVLLLFLGAIICAAEGLYAQTKITTEDYILRFKNTAMEKMRDYKIPASITLAQGILESGSGNSNLARHANNHFGIKCHTGWRGRSYYADDDEKNECFRAYKDPEESYHDHSLFLTQRPRYAFLFELDIMDYKAWAKGLSKAGYATNPRYPELLIRIIERYQLHDYDLIAMDKKRFAEATESHEVHSFVPADTSGFEFSGYSVLGRRVYVNNSKKFVFAAEGDNIKNLAHEFAIYSWQLVKYNELSKQDSIVPGQMIYLEKKRRKSSDHRIHEVQVGDNMYSISQQYGIRLKILQRKNDMPQGVQPAAGTKIRLR
jgi:LysM repeat protein